MKFDNILLMIFFIFLISLVSYVFGSVNSSIIITKCFTKKDIRELGSGNAGFTNVLRSVNILPAMLTFFGDFIKTFLAILVSRKIVGIGFLFFPTHGLVFQNCFGEYIGSFVTLISGFFVILGHIYPCFFSFKGGKAIVCLLAFTLLYDFRVSLSALGVFIFVLIFSKIVSLASIVGTCSLPVFNFFICFVANSKELNYAVISTVFFVMVSVLVVYKHLGNIKRIKDKTEYKISFNKDKT